MHSPFDSTIQPARKPLIGFGGGGLLPLPTNMVSANAVTWFDASDETSITKSVNQVTQINDLTGNNYHASNGAASGPDSGTREENSKNALDYGGSEYLVTSSFGANLQKNTVIVVGRYDTTAAHYLCDGIAFGQRHMVLQSSGYFRIGAPTFLQGPARDGNLHVFAAVYNDASSSFYVDGGSPTTGTAGGDGITGVTLGSSYGLGAFGSHDGTVCEYELYDDELSAGELTSRVDYLKTKWGIT